jgi:ribosome-binding ATPase YchF (GTP1/OBG family)
MNNKESLVWDKVFKALDDGMPVRSINFPPDELAIVKQLPLISAKPLIYVCNIDADSMVQGSNELSSKILFTDIICRYIHLICKRKVPKDASCGSFSHLRE